VKKGDTLAEISRKFYNTSSRWRDVLKANKGLISSPTGLRPDMKLTIPSPERVQVSSRSDKESVKQLVTRTSRSGSKVYKVKKGDTLYSIGKKFYDDASAWRRIREANSDIVDEEDKITPGMKLILP
jgi:nucleoid-associated protein YgaU